MRVHSTMNSGKEIRFVTIPDHVTEPSLVVVNRELERFGVRHILGGSLHADWLRANRGRVELLHLHHPSGWYSRPNPLRFVVALARYCARLVMARRLGYKIVWTAHNVYPHERNNMMLEFLGRKVTVRLAHAVIVYFSAGVEALVKSFGPARRFFVVPFGGYGGWYPNTTSPRAARADLGIPPDAFVYLVFGLIRRYKSIEDALGAFESVRTAGDMLILGGGGGLGDYRLQLGERYRGMRQVVCIPGFVEDSRVQLFFNAADVAVYSFREVFNSGSIHLALAFGRPAIAPRLGCIPEVLTDGCALLYDPGNPRGLERAMREVKGCDLKAMSDAAARRRSAFSPLETARRTVEIYRSLVSGDDVGVEHAGMRLARDLSRAGR